MKKRTIYGHVSHRSGSGEHDSRPKRMRTRKAVEDKEIEFADGEQIEFEECDRDAKWDVVDRALQVLQDGFVRKLNNDSWETLTVRDKEKGDNSD